MDADDDMPPELVEACGGDADDAAEEEKAVKVPITIVTGEPQLLSSWTKHHLIDIQVI